MTTQNPQLLEVDVPNRRQLDARDGSPSNVSPLPLTDRVQSSSKKQLVPQSYNVTDRNEIENNDVIALSGQNATIDARNLKVMQNGVIDQKFESENANIARSIDTQQTYPQVFPPKNRQIYRGNNSLQTSGTQQQIQDGVIGQDSDIVKVQSSFKDRSEEVIDQSIKTIEPIEQLSQMQILKNKKLTLNDEYKNLQQQNLYITEQLENIDKEYQINETLLEHRQNEKLTKIKEIQKQTIQDITDLKKSKEQAWAQRNIAQRQGSNVSQAEITQIKVDAEIVEKKDQLVKIEQYLELEEKKGTEFRNQEIELLSMKKKEQKKELTKQKNQQLKRIEQIRDQFIILSAEIQDCEETQEQDKDKIQFIKGADEPVVAENNKNEDEIAKHRQVFQEAQKQKKIAKARDDFQKIRKEKKIAKHREDFQKIKKDKEITKHREVFQQIQKDKQKQQEIAKHVQAFKDIQKEKKKQIEIAKHRETFLQVQREKTEAKALQLAESNQAASKELREQIEAEDALKAAKERGDVYEIARLQAACDKETKEAVDAAIQAADDFQQAEEALEKQKDLEDQKAQGQAEIAKLAKEERLQKKANQDEIAEHREVFQRIQAEKKKKKEIAKHVATFKKIQDEKKKQIEIAKHRETFLQIQKQKARDKQLQLAGSNQAATKELREQVEAEEALKSAKERGDIDEIARLQAACDKETQEAVDAEKQRADDQLDAESAAEQQKNAENQKKIQQQEIKKLAQQEKAIRNDIEIAKHREVFLKIQKQKNKDKEISKHATAFKQIQKEKKQKKEIQKHVMAYKEIQDEKKKQIEIAKHREAFLKIQTEKAQLKKQQFALSSSIADKEKKEQVEAEEALNAAKERGDVDEIARLQAACDKETREAVDAEKLVEGDKNEADAAVEKQTKLENEKKAGQKEIARLAKQEKETKPRDEAEIAKNREIFQKAQAEKKQKKEIQKHVQAYKKIQDEKKKQIEIAKHREAFLKIQKEKTLLKKQQLAESSQAANKEKKEQVEAEEALKLAKENGDEAEIARLEAVVQKETDEAVDAERQAEDDKRDADAASEKVQNLENEKKAGQKEIARLAKQEKETKPRDEAQIAKNREIFQKAQAEKKQKKEIAKHVADYKRIQVEKKKQQEIQKHVAAYKEIQNAKKQKKEIAKHVQAYKEIQAEKKRQIEIAKHREVFLQIQKEKAQSKKLQLAQSNQAATKEYQEQVEAEEALNAAKERGDVDEIARLQAVCDKETREAVEASSQLQSEKKQADSLNLQLEQIENQKKISQQEIAKLAKEERTLKKSNEEELAKHRAVFQKIRKDNKIAKHREEFQKIQKDKKLAKHRDEFQKIQKDKKAKKEIAKHIGAYQKIQAEKKKQIEIAKHREVFMQIQKEKAEAKKLQLKESNKAATKEMREQIEAEEALESAKARGDTEEIARLQFACDKETREADEAAAQVAQEQLEADQINDQTQKLEDRKKKTQNEIGRLAKEEKKLKKQEALKARQVDINTSSELVEIYKEALTNVADQSDTDGQPKAVLPKSLEVAREVEQQKDSVAVEEEIEDDYENDEDFEVESPEKADNKKAEQIEKERQQAEQIEKERQHNEIMEAIRIKLAARIKSDYTKEKVWFTQQAKQREIEKAAALEQENFWQESQAQIQNDLKERIKVLLGKKILKQMTKEKKWLNEQDLQRVQEKTDLETQEKFWQATQDQLLNDAQDRIKMLLAKSIKKQINKGNEWIKQQELNRQQELADLQIDQQFWIQAEQHGQQMTENLQKHDELIEKTKSQKLQRKAELAEIKELEKQQRDLDNLKAKEEAALQVFIEQEERQKNETIEYDRGFDQDQGQAEVDQADDEKESEEEFDDFIQIDDDDDKHLEEQFATPKQNQSVKTGNLMPEEDEIDESGPIVIDDQRKFNASEAREAPLQQNYLRVSEDPYDVRKNQTTKENSQNAFADSMNDRTPGGRTSLGATQAAEEDLKQAFIQTEGENKSNLSIIEQKIIDLNNEFKIQIDEEAEIELQMIDEIQWLNEIAFQQNLFNSFYSGYKLKPSKSAHYDERIVSYIRPSDLKSFQLLQECESMLLSTKYQIMFQGFEQSRNSLIFITLNNFGQFYLKHQFKIIATQYFELVMKMAKEQNVNTVSMVATMLRTCKEKSVKGLHQDSLEIAIRCVKCLNYEIQIIESQRRGSPQRRPRSSKSMRQELSSKLPKNFWLVIYMSYYNMACELEVLHRTQEALIYFEKAKRVLTTELKDSLPFKSIQQYLVQMPILKPVKIKKLHISSAVIAKGSFKSISSTPNTVQNKKRKQSAKRIRNPSVNYTTTMMSKVLDSNLTRSYIPALQGKQESSKFNEWNAEQVNQNIRQQQHTEMDRKEKNRATSISAYNILYSQNPSPKKRRPASSYVRSEIKSRGLKRVESEKPNHQWKQSNLHLNQPEQSTFSQNNQASISKNTVVSCSNTSDIYHQNKIRPSFTNYNRASLNRDIVKISASKAEFETRKFDQYLNGYFKKQKIQTEQQRIFKKYPKSKAGVIDYQSKTYIDFRDVNSSMRKSDKPKFLTAVEGGTWQKIKASQASQIMSKQQSTRNDLVIDQEDPHRFTQPRSSYKSGMSEASNESYNNLPKFVHQGRKLRPQSAVQSKRYK